MTGDARGSGWGSSTHRLELVSARKPLYGDRRESLGIYRVAEIITTATTTTITTIIKNNRRGDPRHVSESANRGHV